MSFERARRVADAVLYEGYVLYPYRASAAKNRVRWQFGVIAPREWSETEGCETWWMQAACPAEASRGASLEGMLRFLRLRRRSVERARGSGGDAFEPVESLEVAGVPWTSWDEGVETEVAFEAPLAPSATEREVEIVVPSRRSEEPIRASDGRIAGRIVYEEQPLCGAIRIGVEALGSFLVIRVRVENRSASLLAGASRDEALASSFLGTHVLLHVRGSRFVSLTDPEEPARDAAAACANVGFWPVLAGEAGDRSLVLCSPIILEDHPRIAPESPGDFFDATEIDELLTLRTMTLTDEEKREIRTTDPRAAAILDRVEGMPRDVFQRLHGTIRDIDPAPAVDSGSLPERQIEPDGSWDPAVDHSVCPDTDAVEVRGVRVTKGCRVRLRPQGRADAQDMFVEGRVGRVEAVFLDMDGRRHLALTLEDDPAAELQRWHGRYLYFTAEEVEPLEEGS